MKILIAYRTQYGAVERCALIMREKLRGTVELVDLLDYDGLDDFCQKVNSIDSGRAMYPTGQSDSP